VKNEADEILEKLQGNCKLLNAGWSDRIEYTVPVKYHQADCDRRVACTTCPVVDEKRSRYVNRPGLLEQLREFQQSKDVDRNPKAARGAPRVKKPKMHPELAGFLVLDEITCEANTVLDRIFEEAGSDRTWLAIPISSILTGLDYQVKQFVDERPDLARQVLKLTDKWVRQARAALKLSVSDAMFGDTVCPCGGGLSIPWDNSGAVKCIGSPSAAPCGTEYGMDSWVELYEKGKR